MHLSISAPKHAKNKKKSNPWKDKKIFSIWICLNFYFNTFKIYSLLRFFLISQNLISNKININFTFEFTKTNSGVYQTQKYTLHFHAAYRRLCLLTHHITCSIYFNSWHSANKSCSLQGFCCYVLISNMIYNRTALSHSFLL